MDRLEQLKHYLKRYGTLYRHYNGLAATATVPIIFESNTNLKFWVGTTQPAVGTQVGDFWYDHAALMRLRSDGTYRIVTDYWADIPTSIINLGQNFEGAGRFIVKVQISGNNFVNAARKTRYTLNAVWSDEQISIVPASTWLVTGADVPAGTGIVTNAKGMGNFTAGLPAQDTKVTLRATYGVLVAEKQVNYQDRKSVV